MMRLSDSIESFIKTLLSQDETEVELKRNELAEQFGCAPSQINYVLQTRFTPERGYVIESRRGGGGCIRVYRTDMDKREVAHKLLEGYSNGGAMSEKNAGQMLSDLARLGIIDLAQARLMFAAVRNEAINAAGQNRDTLRVNILKNMMTAILAEQ